MRVKYRLESGRLIWTTLQVVMGALVGAAVALYPRWLLIAFLVGGLLAVVTRYPRAGAFILGFAVFSGIEGLITGALIVLLPSLCLSLETRPRVGKVAIPGVAFLGVATLSLLWTPDFPSGLEKVMQTGKGVALLLVVHVLFRHRRDLEAVLLGGTVGTLHFAALGAYAFATGQPTLVSTAPGFGAETRPFLAGFDPNYAAASWAFLLVFLLHTALTAASRLRRNLSMVGSALLAVAVVASGSRGGALGAAVGIVVYLLLSRERLRRVAFGVGILAGGIALSATLFPATFSRFGLTDETIATARGRVTVAGQARTSFASHPLFGLGASGFVDSQRRTGRSSSLSEAHSTPLEVLVDYGLAGALPFVSMVLIPLGRRHPAWVTGAWTGTGVALMSISASSQLFLWLLLGVATSPALGGTMSRRQGKAAVLPSRLYVPTHMS